VNNPIWKKKQKIPTKIANFLPLVIAVASVVLTLPTYFFLLGCHHGCQPHWVPGCS
jgi:hypothetical protein